jgi:hypothetical protein
LGQCPTWTRDRRVRASARKDGVCGPVTALVLTSRTSASWRPRDPLRP